MLEPVTLSAAVSAATTAYNGIKKAITMGREIEDLGGQLSQWMTAVSDVDNIILIDPLAYQDFIWTMNRAKIIITDSGGIQEEAPSLGKPVLVLRDTTERPEAVDAGTVILVGTDKDLIVSEVLDLLNNNIRFEAMSKLHNPYGDGKACERIVEFIAQQEVKTI